MALFVNTFCACVIWSLRRNQVAWSRKIVVKLSGLVATHLVWWRSCLFIFEVKTPTTAPAAEQTLQNRDGRHGLAVRPPAGGGVPLASI